jgi:hypothetical protein
LQHLHPRSQRTIDWEPALTQQGPISLNAVRC